MGHKSNETKEFRNTIIASQGDYKLRGDSDPFTFFFACILIPAKISKTIIVITSATSVIPPSLNLHLFIFFSSYVYFLTFMS